LSTLPSIVLGQTQDIDQRAGRPQAPLLANETGAVATAIIA
jgi:hypothetical protein